MIRLTVDRDVLDLKAKNDGPQHTQNHLEVTIDNFYSSREDEKDSYINHKEEALFSSNTSLHGRMKYIDVGMIGDKPSGPIETRLTPFSLMKRKALDTFSTLCTYMS
jgi:hypothetical protein